MDGLNNDLPCEEALDSSAIPRDLDVSSIHDHVADIRSNNSPLEDPFKSETLVTPSIKVDDVNPALLPPRHPLADPSAFHPRNPSGMLMGPDDPFFQEMQSNPRNPILGNVRYDVIGPFGHEPDPDIDVPRVNIPHRRNQFPPPGGGMFGGGKMGFGGFI